jgi:dTDP-4-dehydrorhamnose reductase
MLIACMGVARQGGEVPRLLITGASGTLGVCLTGMALDAGWSVASTYHRRPLALPIDWHPLDLADRAAAQLLIARLRPTAVIHTAFVQAGPDLWAVTADGAARVALGAVAVGARLVHCSSDALFDGTAGVYDESAPPCPITPYGAAKAAAETAVAAIAPDAAIVRISLILRRHPPDRHSRFALDLAAGRAAGCLFMDEYRCPVAVEDLAAALLDLVGQTFAGVINVAGADALSRHELGCLVAEAHGVPRAAVPSGTLAASGLHRPADVRLDCALARRLLRTRLRGAREYLRNA